MKTNTFTRSFEARGRRCQFGSALTLLAQWRTAHPAFFVLRALCSFAAAALSLHYSVCGRTSPFGPKKETESFRSFTISLPDFG